jgi:DNA-binding transcriptional MerR regulator
VLSIGKFSTLSGISIKALRHYDELGLLRPAFVHPQSGYRYYDAKQSEAAQQIRLLRLMDMPLDEIREFLRSPSEAERRRFLEQQRTELERRLAAAKDGLQLLVEMLRGPVEESEGYAVSVQELPEQKVLGIRRKVSADELHGFIGSSFGKVFPAVYQVGAAIAGPGMTLFHESVEEEETDVEVAVPVDRTVQAGPDLAFHTLPAQRGAVAVHAGAYESLHRCHRAILLWAERNRLQLEGPIRNVYVVGPAQTQDSSQFRTEVRWPIEPG